MHVAVTAVGADRPGIAAAVVKVLYEHGGNVEDSRMAILGGHFAMMLIVALPEGAERPGIVYRVCETLAARRVNITDLATRVVGGDAPVYVMILEATVPAGADA